MTEAGWLTSQDPEAMWRFLDPRNAKVIYSKATGMLWNDMKGFERKCRLFCVACSRRYHRPRSNSLYDEAEKSDGRKADWGIPIVTAWVNKLQTHPDESPAAKADLFREIFGNPWALSRLPTKTREEFCPSCQGDGGWERSLTDPDKEWEDPCQACKGKGTVPIERIDLPWVTAQGKEMAEAICQSRAWGDLPHLADLCEESGCPPEVDCWSCDGFGGNSPEAMNTWDCGRCGKTGRLPSPILDHFRQPGQHTLGCWALDLIRFT